MFVLNGFFVYLVLGILLLNALRRNDVIRNNSIVILICVLYAISDEFHQVFVPGRGPNIRDVFIDSTGTLVGILIYLGVKKVRLSKYFRFL
ncbi:VanZ family protein [Caloramator sp. E03]|uniref:VanZ family protein n=1 Tax=Caloramator sp. E03 TaxID=2576307 RepID=UPI001110BA0E|nr:VanZ family protein [Caloramator sp. E03]QCX34380.1 VanZ family protein [Caloramator sp. E03]